MYCLFTGISNVTADNATNPNTISCNTEKKQSNRINTLMFGIIGLAALSFLTYLIYRYTCLLDKRQVNTV